MNTGKILITGATGDTGGYAIDVIQKIGGRQPMSLEAFIQKHRKAFQ